MLRIALTSSIFIISCVAEPEPDVYFRSGSYGDQVETVVEFDPMLGETPESVAVGFHGEIYVSLALTGEIRRIDPDGTQSTFAMIPLGPPSGCAGPLPGLITALALDLFGNVYVGANACDPDNRGIWRITPSGSAKRIAALPTTSVANGIAIRAGRVYAADSAQPVIWRASTFGNGAPAEIWTEDPLLADNDPFDLDPGSNGIQFYGGSAYVSNSGAATIVQIPFELGGLLGGNLVAQDAILRFGPPGSGALYETPELPGCDDFAFDLIGRMYCTTNPYQSILRIDPDGDVEVILDAEDGVDGPTSATFGRGHDITTLYVSNAAFPFFPGTGFGPSVIAVDLNFPGYPLR